MKRFFIGILALFGITFLFRRWIISILLRLRFPESEVIVERGIRIRMDDGINLATDHYAPKNVSSASTILIRSPYGRYSSQSMYGRFLELYANRFAERGYHVLVQDVRGRFDSEGEFDPMLNEKADGLTTVAWLRKQAWFNGELCMWGASYLGVAQWVIAHEVPEVKAIIPIFTGSDLYPILFPDGVLNYGFATRWISIFKLLDDLRDSGSIIDVLMYPMKIEQFSRRVCYHLPIVTADETLLGEENLFFRRLEHNTTPDTTLWQEVQSMVDVANVQVPVHLIGGWYDFFLRQQLKDYQTLKAAGNQPYLTIGKWMHFNNMNGLIAGVQEGLPFFDTHTGKGSKIREKPVKVFVMGADEWREMDDFPPQTHPKKLYLNNSHLLSELHKKSGKRTYTYDPLHPTPAIGGVQFTFDTNPMKDNRRLQSRGDVIVFTGDFLESPIEIMGEVKVVLFVQSSAESADFFVRLCDVTPDGRALNIADGLYRIRCHANEGIHCVEIALFPTAHQFKLGHRIQVMIASAFHPHWARNLGTTESYIHSTEAVAGKQTVFFGGETPSHIILPTSK